jgi:hypothetical protein
MNDETRGRRRLRRMRPPMTGLAAIVAGVALLTVACGGTTPAVQAKSAKTQPAQPPLSSSSPPGSSAQSADSLGLEFSQCMRSHGITNFPDPGSNGEVAISVGSGVQVKSPAFQEAQDACAKFAGNTGTPAEQARDETDLLRYASCMRSHGITDFPDPVRTIDGAYGFVFVNVDFSTPAYQSAHQVCQHLEPGEGHGT